jgi:hypothetical protein
VATSIAPDRAGGDERRARGSGRRVAQALVLGHDTMLLVLLGA